MDTSLREIIKLLSHFLACSRRVPQTQLVSHRPLSDSAVLLPSCPVQFGLSYACSAVAREWACVRLLLRELIVSVRLSPCVSVLVCLRLCVLIFGFRFYPCVLFWCSPSSLVCSIVCLCLRLLFLLFLVSFWWCGPTISTLQFVVLRPCRVPFSPSDPYYFQILISFSLSFPSFPFLFSYYYYYTIWTYSSSTGTRFYFSACGVPYLRRDLGKKKEVGPDTGVGISILFR